MGHLILTPSPSSVLTWITLISSTAYKQWTIFRQFLAYLTETIVQCNNSNATSNNHWPHCASRIGLVQHAQSVLISSKRHWGQKSDTSRQLLTSRRTQGPNISHHVPATPNSTNNVVATQLSKTKLSDRHNGAKAKRKFYISNLIFYDFLRNFEILLKAILL